MDPAAQLLQTTLTGLGLLTDGSMPSNSTSNTTQAAATSWNSQATAADPTATFNLNSILSLLLSLSALRDWIKLFVIGSVIETCRRTALKVWATFVESFWITACFDGNDESYNWIMFWLSKHPKWKQARMIDVSTRTFGLNSPAVSIAGDDDEDEDSSSRKLCYLPSFSRTYSLWYKGHYLSIMRTESQEGIYGATRESLQINILAMNHSFLNGLLLEAKKEYLAAEEHVISIYVSEMSGGWRHVASRPKRPLNSIVLDPGVKDLLLDDAKDFLQSKEWYMQRGIPFRRGYLLYGAPGSGKTSMIHSLAGELGLNVYIISLSRAGLDDTTLSELISDLPEKCIALMEDIDAAFTRGLTRKINDEHEAVDNDTAEDGTQTDTDNADGKERDKDHVVSAPASRVTLSGLLNALDGVGAQEGRILYATTNCYKALDPALCRPGRMDLHVEFKLASKYQAKELFKCFYLPPPPPDDKASDRSSRNRSRSPSRSRSSSQSSAECTASVPESEKTETSCGGMRHGTNSIELSTEKVLELADRFEGAIPEREFSMASLQGYLMSYKIRPTAAVEDATAWVEAERAKKTKKRGKNGSGSRLIPLVPPHF